MAVFLVLSVPFTFNLAFADCNVDHDWPEKPCLDMPPYSKSELVWNWDKYHSMKGQEWIEVKKSEMDHAIDNGILKKWFAFDGPQNSQNHNVYFYYFLHDQAPDVEGVYFAEQILQKEDRNPAVERYDSDLPDNDISNVIITYYYINSGGLLVLALVAAAIGAGFFGCKQIIAKRDRVRK